MVYFNRIHFVSYKKITKYIDICNTFFKLLVGGLLIYYYYFIPNSKDSHSLMVTAGFMLLTSTIENVIATSKS